MSIFAGTIMFSLLRPLNYFAMTDNLRMTIFFASSLSA